MGTSDDAKTSEINADTIGGLSDLKATAGENAVEAEVEDKTEVVEPEVLKMVDEPKEPDTPADTGAFI